MNTHNSKPITNNHKGYIALLTVIIVSAVTLASALSVGLLAISETDAGRSQVKGENTLQFVEGCAEDMLNKVQNDIAYNGTSISRPEGTCGISIVSKVGTTWTVDVTNLSSQTYQRTVEVVFSRTLYGLTIISWKEI